MNATLTPTRSEWFENHFAQKIQTLDREIGCLERQLQYEQTQLEHGKESFRRRVSDTTVRLRKAKNDRYRAVVNKVR